MKLSAAKMDPIIVRMTSTASEYSARVGWVDSAKGIGIILVVFAHVVRGLVNSHIWMWSPTSLFLDGWIYAFHMPLFFFLSGLFLFRSAQKPLLLFVTEKLRTLAYPYFVWSVITLLIKTPLSGVTNRADGLSELPLILYEPIEQYWFLYVLLVLSLLIAALLKLGVRTWIVFALAILVYPGLLPTAPLEWGVLALASACAMYVALGVIVGSRNGLLEISGLSVGELGFIVLAGLIISAFGGISGLPYRYALTPLFALAGTYAVVALAVTVEKTTLNSVLRLMGRRSLEIYVAHTIVSAGVRVALLKFCNVSDVATHHLLGTLAGLSLPIAFALVLDRIGFPYAFTLPAPRKRPPAPSIHPPSNGLQKFPSNT
jgi:fucose 4-O-acetylase-like acetyltransferase